MRNLSNWLNKSLFITLIIFLGEAYASPLCSVNPRIRTECEREWTTLVFMQADNDLSPYAFWDLYEMQASNNGFAGSTKKMDVVVEVDVLGNDVINRYHIQENNNKYDEKIGLEVFEKQTFSDVTSPVLMTLNEAALDEKEIGVRARLERFLDWGMKRFPSKRYLVIFWGHGEGWSTGGDFQSLGGFGRDDSNGSKLSVLDIKKVLKRITKKHGTIDIFATDACLMQNLEVAYEIAPYADFIIGSSQVQSFQGFPYRELFYQINSGDYLQEKSKFPNQESYKLAKKLPDLYAATFNNRDVDLNHHQQRSKLTLTMSSLASYHLQNDLLDKLDDLVDELIIAMNADPFLKLNLQKVVQTIPQFLGESRDLSTILAYLNMAIYQANLDVDNQDEIKRGIRKLKDEINYITLNYVQGDNYTGYYEQDYLLGHFKGLSIWLPSTKESYQSRIEQFKKSTVYRKSHWDEFLAKLYSEDAIPFKF